MLQCCQSSTQKGGKHFAACNSPRRKQGSLVDVCVTAGSVLFHCSLVKSSQNRLLLQQDKCAHENICAAGINIVLPKMQRACCYLLVDVHVPSMIHFAVQMPEKAEGNPKERHALSVMLQKRGLPPALAKKWLGTIAPAHRPSM
jgi:hypothetical protein